MWIRKIVIFDEVVLREGGRLAVPPLRTIGVAAVIKNPWHGRGFVDDLSPEKNRIAPVVGKLFPEALIHLQVHPHHLKNYLKIFSNQKNFLVQNLSLLGSNLNYLA